MRAPSGDPKKVSLGKKVDVRKSLAMVAPASDQLAAHLRQRLGWAGQRIITFGTTLSAEGSARPAEVLEALLGPAVAARAEIARIALHAAAPGAGAAGDVGQIGRPLVDPFDTVALRGGQGRTSRGGSGAPAPAADAPSTLA